MRCSSSAGVLNLCTGAGIPGSARISCPDRSERVRTYNFAENRISDHRVGFKAYNLDAVLDGDLDAVVDALVSGLASPDDDGDR